MRIHIALLLTSLVTACSPGDPPGGPDRADESDLDQATDTGDTDGNVADSEAPHDDDLGGGDTTGGDDSGDGMPTGPNLAERIAAATQTAENNAACSLTELPEGFYWEIGDRDGALASGSVAGSNTPTPSQVIAIASASKWIYASYVLQKVGSVRESDVPYLHFTSGEVYPLGSGSNEATCGIGETVGECAAGVELVTAAVDKFYYSAGHFQWHATNVMGMGDLGAVALGTEINSQLGPFAFQYLQTNLAGGVNASANAYTGFLRKMLRGELLMTAELDNFKVCASSACAAGAVLSPAPPDEAWSYGLGHWVEDDPEVGDHAFSSAGALGFYPWIDASRTWYGVVARRAASAGGSQGVVSLRCGRLIRQAWVTGVTVTSTTPTP